MLQILTRRHQHTGESTSTWLVGGVLTLSSGYVYYDEETPLIFVSHPFLRTW